MLDPKFKHSPPQRHEAVSSLSSIFYEKLRNAKFVEEIGSSLFVGELNSFKKKVVEEGILVMDV